MDVPQVDVDELEALAAGGAVVVDVREPHEWEEGHIEGAVLISMGDIPERVDDLPDVDPVYVICRTGNRSERVTDFLRRQGIDAYNVVGGMVAWQESGRPVRYDPTPS